VPKDKRIIVNSHERSGTHFLMNSLANNFGYQSVPWINLDNPPLPLYYPANMINILMGITEFKENERTIIKSHFNGDFFNGLMDKIKEHYHVFYIYREAIPTMKSCHKHFNDMAKSKMYGGPTCKTVEEFAESQPWGACLRYQYQQYDTMAERHEHHVESWIKHEPILVKYEELNENFDNTIKALSVRLDMPLMHGVPIRPSKANTIQDGMFNDKDALKV